MNDDSTGSPDLSKNSLSEWLCKDERVRIKEQDAMDRMGSHL